MTEREKQQTDQQDKHKTEKERREQSTQDASQQPEQPQAGMSTDPKAMKDKGYVQRIDEKTSKH